MKLVQLIFPLAVVSACSGAAAVPVPSSPHTPSVPATSDQGATTPPAAHQPTGDAPGGAPASDKAACPCQSKHETPAPDGGTAPASVPLPQGTKVLHVGDSFAGALGIPLGALLEQAQVKSVLKHTDASYLTDWAWNGELQKLLWKYNPDLLIITLGANELGISEPTQRIKTIKKIVSLVGERPCLWVGIPLWDSQHNGLMDVIRDNVAPCVYWDTNRLLDVEHMPRISDGIHPTTEARKDWARDVFSWLEAHRRPNVEKPWVLVP